MATYNTPFLFVGNGQYANRGCQAITKSSVRLIREYYPDAPIINGNELGDYDQIDETEPGVTHKYCPCGGASYKRMNVSLSIYDKLRLKVDISKAGEMVREYAPKCRAVISMGGDLYGLSHGRKTLLQYIFLGEAALKCGKPFIIWGATIGNVDTAGSLKKVAMDHFKKCSLILVRDQSSFDYLAQNGIRDNLRLVADPAFLIDPEEPQIRFPNREPLEEMIGFNLASNYGTIGNLGSYRDMIKLGADCVESITESTGRSVILIPHIVAFPADTYGNDTIFLELVREELISRGMDVPLLPSCLKFWEIKWVLSKLRGYVGSRFHSTISSFGSCTPTVSVSFSEKAPALNKLLLGHSDFVLSCKDLTVPNLIEKVNLMLSQEEIVRTTLRQRIPEIKALAHSAGDHLRDFLGS